MGKRLSHEELAEIVDAHTAALVLFARQWSTDLAADVVQEAFLQLVRCVQADDVPDNIGAWLYRVVRNELITQHHRRRSAHTREQRVAAERMRQIELQYASQLPSAQFLREQGEPGMSWDQMFIEPLERGGRDDVRTGTTR